MKPTTDTVHSRYTLHYDKLNYNININIIFILFALGTSFPKALEIADKNHCNNYNYYY